MTPDLKHNLKSTAIWLRGLYMLLFFVVYQIAEVVLGGVVVIQFLLVLATGRRNERLLVFGRQRVCVRKGNRSRRFGIAPQRTRWPDMKPGSGPGARILFCQSHEQLG